MKRYCVDKNAQLNGDHEVHEFGCVRVPRPGNRIDLGRHISCLGAMFKAKEHFGQVNGCYDCCRACRSG